jgi:16S rRNA (guanine527-N7)-methyltransferase
MECAVDSLAKIDASARACGVSLRAEHKDRWRAYLSLLEKWSRRMNLISVKDTGDLLRFHFLEACWVAEAFLASVSTLADIGTGAGFPGMVIKLYRPQIAVSLIEKSFRKAVFLSHLAQHLSLQAEIFNGLAEDFPKWEEVELASIRALRPSARLLQSLAEHRVELLILHGACRPSPGGFQPVKQARFPLSKNRWASLYKPVPL